ncbi:MAG TPA: hypothetical protein DHW71_06890 [Gammaproteobacteria bacterium]|nr:hypothetical protein [Gammaproteobacteria bacterium]HBF08000.1 hypothetical protein [Gammaproteobacteria bacterium]HCK92692.1 hypothetical protein [Gammaproteobacteria bacterium]|tara:strand:+ start:2072 stop:2563 length:492 start_codon:yes stop_codon:yes gene_type:complete
MQQINNEKLNSIYIERNSKTIMRTAAFFVASLIMLYFSINGVFTFLKSVGSEFLTVDRGIIILFGGGVAAFIISLGDLIPLLTKKRLNHTIALGLLSGMVFAVGLMILSTALTNVIAKPILMHKGYIYCKEASDTVQISTYEYLYARSESGCKTLELKKEADN